MSFILFPSQCIREEGDFSSVKLVDFGNAIHCVYAEVSLYYDDFELQTLLYRAPEVGHRNAHARCTLSTTTHTSTFWRGYYHANCAERPPSFFCRPYVNRKKILMMVQSLRVPKALILFLFLANSSGMILFHFIAISGNKNVHTWK